MLTSMATAYHVGVAPLAVSQKSAGRGTTTRRGGVTTRYKATVPCSDAKSNTPLRCIRCIGYENAWVSTTLMTRDASHLNPDADTTGACQAQRLSSERIARKPTREGDNGLYVCEILIYTSPGSAMIDLQMMSSRQRLRNSTNTLR